MLVRTRELLVPLLLLSGCLAAVHHLVFWMANWQFLPRLAWLIVLLCALGAFPLVAAWYYCGRSRAPILAGTLAVIAVDALSIGGAGGLNLSRLSYTQGFNAEIAMLMLPLVAYFGAFALSRLGRQRG